MFCGKCGAKNDDGARFCAGCGAAAGLAPERPEAAPATMARGREALAEDEEYCFSCGLTVKKAAAICPKCGVGRESRMGAPASIGGGGAVAALVMVSVALFLAIAAWGGFPPPRFFFFAGNLFHGGGAILAVLALWAGKNKAAFVAGAMAGAIPLLNMLRWQVLFFLFGG